MPLIISDTLGRRLAFPPDWRLEITDGPWLVSQAVWMPMPAGLITGRSPTPEQLSAIHQRIPQSYWMGDQSPAVNSTD